MGFTNVMRQFIFISQKEDSRKNALAPTPQQQAPKLSDRDNALRLSSNMEELKAAVGKKQRSTTHSR